MKRSVLFLLIMTSLIIPLQRGNLWAQEFDAKTEVERYVVSFWRVDLSGADFKMGIKQQIQVFFIAPTERSAYDMQPDPDFQGNRTGLKVDFSVGNGSVTYADTSWFDVDVELTPGFYEMAVKVIDQNGLESKYWEKTFTFLILKNISPKRGKLMSVRY
ncbi:MAG: hypothetical protein ACE5D6_08180 [Candidatus Zixiibacteriota bacterium]